jgi:hypothetical protein
MKVSLEPITILLREGEFVKLRLLKMGDTGYEYSEDILLSKETEYIEQPKDTDISIYPMAYDSSGSPIRPILLVFDVDEAIDVKKTASTLSKILKAEPYWIAETSPSRYSICFLHSPIHDIDRTTAQKCLKNLEYELISRRKIPIDKNSFNLNFPMRLCLPGLYNYKRKCEIKVEFGKVKALRGVDLSQWIVASTNRKSLFSKTTQDGLVSTEEKFVEFFQKYFPERISEPRSSWGGNAERYYLVNCVLCDTEDRTPSASIYVFPEGAMYFDYHTGKHYTYEKFRKAFLQSPYAEQIPQDELDHIKLELLDYTSRKDQWTGRKSFTKLLKDIDFTKDEDLDLDKNLENNLGSSPVKIPKELQSIQKWVDKLLTYLDVKNVEAVFNGKDYDLFIELYPKTSFYNISQEEPPILKIPSSSFTKSRSFFEALRTDARFMIAPEVVFLEIFGTLKPPSKEVFELVWNFTINKLREMFELNKKLSRAHTAELFKEAIIKEFFLYFKSSAYKRHALSFAGFINAVREYYLSDMPTGLPGYIKEIEKEKYVLYIPKPTLMKYVKEKPYIFYNTSPQMVAEMLERYGGVVLEEYDDMDFYTIDLENIELPKVELNRKLLNTLIQFYKENDELFTTYLPESWKKFVIFENGKKPQLLVSQGKKMFVRLIEFILWDNFCVATGEGEVAQMIRDLLTTFNIPYVEKMLAGSFVFMGKEDIQTGTTAWISLKETYIGEMIEIQFEEPEGVETEDLEF